MSSEDRYKDKEKRKRYRREYMRVYQRKWDKAHPEQTRQKYVKYRVNLRKRVMEVLGGAKCSNCGCDAVEILEINHIDGGGRQEHKKITSPYNFFRDIVHKRVDITKYNILCRVCNALHYVEHILGIKGHKVIWENIPVA